MRANPAFSMSCHCPSLHPASYRDSQDLNALSCVYLHRYQIWTLASQQKANLSSINWEPFIWSSLTLYLRLQDNSRFLFRQIDVKYQICKENFKGNGECLLFKPPKVDVFRKAQITICQLVSMATNYTSAQQRASTWLGAAAFESISLQAGAI